MSTAGGRGDALAVLEKDVPYDTGALGGNLANPGTWRGVTLSPPGTVFCDGSFPGLQLGSFVKAAVDRQHEQEALAGQLDVEVKRIKRIVRRLDSRLVLILAVLYVWAFIDRGKPANFFVGYILIDAPATFIVRKIGALVWLPTIVVCSCNAKDWKVWEFSFHGLFNNTALYAFAYFLPVILQKSLHYPTSKAQLFTFPPYAVAAQWILFCAWICDRLKVRGLMLVLNSSLYMIGVCITAFCENPHARYGGVFIGVMGITGNASNPWAYAHNNVGKLVANQIGGSNSDSRLVGQAERALCAVIIAGNIFQAKDAPAYRTALIIYIAFQSFNILLVVNNSVDFARAHKKDKQRGVDHRRNARFLDLAFTSDLPQEAFNDNAHIHHDSRGPIGRVEPETSFSRFGSPLPALHFETREQASRGSGQAELNANCRPVWKISGHHYRQIVTNIQKFDQVMPKGFSMPSRHTMFRFLEGAIKGYYEHLPNLHVLTFSPVQATPELILSMCAIGVLFRFEAHRCPMMFHAAKAIAFEQIKIQEQARLAARASLQPQIPLSMSLGLNNTQRPSELKLADIGDKVMDPDVQTLQALIALLCLGAWGSQPELVKEAIALQSVAAPMVRGDGFSRLRVTSSPCAGMSEWHRWVLQESRKRTKLMTYCNWSPLPTTYLR
ncbi:hypothetical protein PV08_11253 [Exophiala spinifera]|uniref:Xylanolytic transcriptional activator regulatory domain-containing protein n=1 Tax=Exophiala spinifera TaxID=91928 RepID=A0A0D1Y5V5_9EURO|nr:uncharacterized protein PV08_11253 [Exophiala spinifera]KIW10291.1 hypothetical protein PV08_11253 [Exophiala spinifera]